MRETFVHVHGGQGSTYGSNDFPGTEPPPPRRRRDPPARLRRLPGPARGHRRGHDPGVPGGLPPHRHRRRVQERGRRRPGVPRLRAVARGRVHHHQVLQRRPRLRAGQARPARQPGPSRARPRRPLPDPLARPQPGPLRGDLEGVHRAPAGGPDALDRRVQLPARAPAPDRRRDRRDAVGQPGRAAPVPRPGGAAPRARGPRDPHRGVEPARAGRRARRARRSRRSPRPTARRPARS